ncbi:MAG: MFS transporter [Candidatus Lambdaproteobacteria bacterium]|nr:MFS transporter [Candidatus Lambdaproteobacteria bacterium]
MRTVRLIAAMCLAEAFSMTPFAVFPALVPTFIAEWRLTNTEVGWINGMFFAGYTVAVPILASLTDRMDTRWVYLPSMLLSALASALFVLAGGFWSALALRTLAGVGLAGTYMPGLKALSDLIEGPSQSRAVAFYTSSFGIGTSLSFLLAGEIGRAFGWAWAFAAAALGPVAGALVFAAIIPPRPALRRAAAGTRLADFVAVLRNRRAMGYVLAYAAHNFELFGFRSWVVAFLNFARGLNPGADGILRPTTLTAAFILAGQPASILGNEMALKIGRQRWVTIVMWTSGLLACALGFLAALPYLVLAGICLIYGMTLMGESAPVTAGTLFESDPAFRGTSMAVHSFIGFLGSSLGPLIFGWVLDLTGGGLSVGSWGTAFATMGLVVACGPLFLLALHRPAAQPVPAAPSRT